VSRAAPLNNVICGKCFGLGWADANINALSEAAKARLYDTQDDGLTVS